MKLMFAVFFFAASAHAARLALPSLQQQSDELSPIAYRYTATYSKIWDDRGSGAYEDVSIWRPVVYQSGFYPLGDVAVATHSTPDVSSMIVKELESGSLVMPTGLSEVWRDSGSGARADVRIFKMTAPSGYDCLGYIAINSYSEHPDKTQYRCVKSSYLTGGGSYQPLWKDSGSGAKKDVGLWSNTEVGGVKGLFSNTFSAFATHSSPSGEPNLLSRAYATIQSLLPVNEDSDIAITLYEGTGMDCIWNDKGSGATYDVSTWRPNGPENYFSLGDIAVQQHTKPRISITAKAMKDDVLRPPTGYQLIWKDTGSGANWDGSFWEPICQGGYRSLGYVSVRSYSQPSYDDVRCVNAKYTIDGKWTWIWNDRNSGAHADVGIWQADPSSGGSGQGVIAMSSVASHGSMNRQPYVLNPTYVNYVVGKPVKKLCTKKIFLGL